MHSTLRFNANIDVVLRGEKEEKTDVQMVVTACVERN